MNRKTPRLQNFAVLALLIALFLGSGPARAKGESTGILYQVSTLQSLGLGIFDGPTTFGELMKHGDFGLGTLNALDGELIILDGQAWQARFDGKMVRIARDVKTPFAILTRFQSERGAGMVGAEYSELQRNLSEQFLTTPNVIYAIKIKGVFSRLKIRSVPRQNRPYGTLADAVKNQATWEWKNISGTLVGFRFPSYLAGVNLAEYHFHFLSDDRTRGGHVLDCRLASGNVQTQSLRKFEMILPRSEEFDRADLAQDQKSALHQAERSETK